MKRQDLLAPAGGTAPGKVALALAACLIGCANAASAQINYDLFPGYGEVRNYPPVVNYLAWVVSYRDNKYYRCVANYDFAAPATPTLGCSLGGSFDPPLLSGDGVKTLQAFGGPRGGPGTDQALSAFFWQIDQTSGQVRFCIPTSGVNCASFQITP